MPETPGIAQELIQGQHDDMLAQLPLLQAQAQNAIAAVHRCEGAIQVCQFLLAKVAEPPQET